MYNVKINNNYVHPVTVGSTTIGTLSNHAFTNWGSHICVIPGMGELNFLDIADKKIPGYTGEGYPMQTWGALIRFHMTEVYFRYEGQGNIEVTIDRYGNVAVKMINGSAMIIALEELVLV